MSRIRKVGSVKAVGLILYLPENFHKYLRLRWHRTVQALHCTAECGENHDMKEQRLPDGRKDCYGIFGYGCTNEAV